MRKLAPVFVLTSIVALTSGSALALGDRNKDRKSPNADTTATQSSTYSSPSGSASTNGASKADSTHGATVSSTAKDKPTDGATVSSVAKSNKEACKGLAKSDPAYAANQCDKLDKSAKQASAGSGTSSSGSGK